MHAGLNLVFLVPGQTGGMEIYARELLRALPRVEPQLRLTTFVAREARAAGGPWDDAGDVVEVPVAARSRVRRVAAEQTLLPRLARRAGVDVLHSLGTTAPAWGRFRRVTTIHDLLYRVVPDAHFGLMGAGMRVLVPLAARRSDRIIAISNATAGDLQRYLRTPPERVDVVHEGVGTTLAVGPEDAATLRARLQLDDRPVALTLSAKRPHKNLIRLLDAIASIPRERRPVLVLPGYPTPHERELREHAAAVGVTDDVRFLGWVSAAELEGLYAVAAVFAFPSLYEGFGLPVLEAMRRGVPVVCSDRSSLPEVAGDAAVLFDPEDTAAIASALERVLGDGEEARRLAAAGCAQAARFTWESCARETVASYRAALAA